MISSPIKTYPGFVDATPTFSNVEKLDELTSTMLPESPLAYAAFNVVGVISVYVPEITTLLFKAYIPWFL